MYDQQGPELNKCCLENLSLSGCPCILVCVYTAEMILVVPAASFGGIRWDEACTSSTSVWTTCSWIGCFGKPFSQRFGAQTNEHEMFQQDVGAEQQHRSGRRVLNFPVGHACSFMW